MNNYSDLSIIVPTINERENLEKLIYTLKDLYPGVHLYIPDDGSTDGTIEYIGSVINSGFDSPIFFLDRTNNKIITNKQDFDTQRFYSDNLKLRNIPGLTASVLDTLSIVDTDKFAVMDADFQHPPALIGKMYDKLLNADLISACRTDLGDFKIHRKILTKTGVFIAKMNLPSHSRVNDPLSGAFAGKTEKMRPYISNTATFELKGLKVLYDLLKSLSPDITIAEAGYKFEMRSAGESKIGFKHLLLFYKSLFSRKRRKLITGLALMTGFMLLGLLLILIYGDIAISQILRSYAKEHVFLLKSAKFITDYGNPLYYSIFVIFALIGIKKSRRRFIKVVLIYLLVQLIASIILTGGLKILVGRPRPGHGLEHHFFTNRSTYKSFPSGHTADAFSSAGVLWGFLPSYALSYVSFFFSLLIGLSRILVGKHYMLDVIAGMVIAFLTGLIITARNLKD